MQRVFALIAAAGNVVDRGHLRAALVVLSFLAFFGSTGADGVAAQLVFEEGCCAHFCLWYCFICKKVGLSGVSVFCVLEEYLVWSLEV